MVNSFLCFSLKYPGGRYRPQTHIHNFHEILLITDGSGFQIYEDRTIPASKGDIFFFPAGVSHISYAPKGESFDLLGFYIPENIFKYHPMDTECDAVLSWLIEYADTSPGLPSYFLQIGTEVLQRLYDEYSRRERGYMSVCRQLLTQFFIGLLRNDDDEKIQIPLSGIEKSSHVIDQALAFINANFDYDLSVDVLLGFCNVSRSHFHYLFKKSTGKTLTAYITEKRIERAVRLLKDSDLSIAEVAYSNGFSSQSYFSKVFKRLVGMSPREYRDGG